MTYEWEAFVSYPGDGPAPAPPVDSLAGVDRVGSLVLEHTSQWRQCVRITANDGTNEVVVQLDAQQAERMIEGLRRWYRGILADWLNGDPDALPACDKCGGAGFARDPSS